MIHHLRRDAILSNWREGFRADAIARMRDVTEAEVIAVLLIDGIPLSKIRTRDRHLRREPYPRIRVARLLTLMNRKVS